MENHNRLHPNGISHMKYFFVWGKTKIFGIEHTSRGHFVVYSWLILGEVNLIHLVDINICMNQQVHIERIKNNLTKHYAFHIKYEWNFEILKISETIFWNPNELSFLVEEKYLLWSQYSIRYFDGSGFTSAEYTE